MLRNITNFVRGFIFGLVVGGSAGMLIAPKPGENTQSTLRARIQAARLAFQQGRTQAEKDLLEYFERAKGTRAGEEA
ncbi:MAG: YtxH domain-containing protein [Chloroflexi bacterium]|nr:MAG: YtxH domain-containing protein [Chloroflexota bacterium]